MHSRVARLVLMALVCALISVPALAQGGNTSSIAGVVVDSDGGAVPGATITARNTGTGATFTVVSGAAGQFTIPSVATGTYTVTASLQGFKAAVIDDVVVTAGGPATVRAVLEVGAVTENVVVQARSEIIQTQASTVSSRINVDEIVNLPLTSRNVLDFVVQLPGVSTPGANRNSSVNGLTQSSINITLDGINVQDNTNKTGDGFFAIVTPRLDAIEEVTVTGAAQGADAAGTGAVQIRFVTRSGSNAFSGSAYHYFRDDALNANTFFNERDGVPTRDLRLNQPGFRLGGPIVIPGVFDGHNKAFFFFNYEEFRQPGSVTRLRTVLTPEAQAGIFRYNTAEGVASVNLFDLAAVNGITSTVDPTVQRLLADIRTASLSTGSITNLADPNLQRLTFNNPSETLNRYPTTRIDVNLSERHRLSGSLNYNSFRSTPDTLNNRDAFFPGFPVQAGQTSERIAVSTSLRSTFGQYMVNELRVGGSGSPLEFSPELNPALYNGPVANQAGFLLNISNANITNAGTAPTPSSRNAYNFLIEDTLNWQRGSHGLNIGGSYEETRIRLRNQTQVPTLTLDVLDGTTAKTVFSTAANFPGSSGTNRVDAEDLYAVLVGSVAGINGDARIDADSGQYVYLGPSLQEGKLPDLAFWIQDAWRPRPDITINLGLRYQLQLPFRALNASYSSTTLDDVWGVSGNAPDCDPSEVSPATCNIFKPGLTGGKTSAEFNLFQKGEHPYGVDWNNVAPSIGAAWTPSAFDGWLSRVLGQPGDTVIRAGWSRAFQRNGLGDITGLLDNNPGPIIQDVDRTEALGNVLPNGADVLLLRTPELLGPAPFPLTRSFPLSDSVTQDVTWFDPDLQIAYADTWSAGWQRSVSRSMAVEVRYVGTRSRDLWQTFNINEIDILDNGVLDEFLLAQQNLQANIAAGRGASFRFFGPGTGTSPLPISLAYFSGRTDAENAAAYASTQFANATFVNPLAAFNPNPFGFANALDAQASFRANALAAGLPSNFLVANPDKLGGAVINGNGGFTNFDGLQVELRRRMADGLQFQASYAYGKAYLSDFFSFRVPFRDESLDTGGEGGVTHAFKVNWLFELPFGQGRRWGRNAGPVLDRIIGGWQIHGVGRFQSGEILDFGNVRLVGFDTNELRDLVDVRIDAAGNVTFLPDDIIENSIKAFSVSATSPTGYSALGAPEGRYFAPANGPDCIETISNGFGDCGARHIEVDGPWFKNVDIAVVKAVPITGQVRAEFRVEMLNAFNTVNFDPIIGVGGTTETAFQGTGLVGATQARVVQLVSRVTW